MPTPRPERIEIDTGVGQMQVDWDDGLRTQGGFVLLREACRCADCRRAEVTGTPVRAAAGIRITAAEPVGDYGLRMFFDDGHDRGIYPWEYLRGILLPVSGESP
jgi:DUF971 family protein